MEFTKEDFKSFLDKAKSITYQDQFEIVKQYIFDKKGVVYNPQNVDVHQLIQAFPIAFEYYLKQFNAFTLRDSRGQVLKHYI